MAESLVEIKYRNWLLSEIDEFVDLSSNQNVVLVMLTAAGLVDENEFKQIAKNSSTTETWHKIYKKIGKIGYEEVDTIIDILQRSGNTSIAGKFLIFVNDRYNEQVDTCTEENCHCQSRMLT